MEHNDAIPFERILAKARDLAGGITQLAEALNVSVPTIYAWSNGNRIPKKTNRTSVLEYISNHSKYVYPPTRVSDNNGQNIVMNDADNVNATYISVPLVDSQCQHTSDKYPFRADWLRRISKNNEEKVFMYRNIGLQMKPLFPSQAMLLINPSGLLIHKKIYLIYYNKVSYIRRFFDASPKYIFKVENKEFELQNLIFNDRSEFTLLGEVIWVGAEL